MPDIQYRLFFNNTPAAPNQLARVEEITVEQEADMVWEARIEIPVCVDEKGRWRGEDEEFMKSFARVRVEIQVGKNPFVPLIDGPVVGFDDRMSFEPGQSSATVIVQDDSVNLNRKEEILNFENMLDYEIAEQIFNDFKEFIDSTQIENTPASGSPLKSETFQRGTSMQLLRYLARRQGKHAYVLPGDNPGKSIGCFKSFPTEAGEFPPLILLGSEGNLASFNTTKNAQKPATVTAATLRIRDKAVITSISTYGDLELLGDKPSIEEGEFGSATHILPPCQGESVNLDQTTTAHIRKATNLFEATGSVRGQRYKGVLRAYDVVTVRAGETSLSGNYEIHKVTHTLTRSDYSQSFGLKRNAESEKSSKLQNLPGGKVF